MKKKIQGEVVILILIGAEVEVEIEVYVEEIVKMNQKIIQVDHFQKIKSFREKAIQSTFQIS